MNVTRAHKAETAKPTMKKIGATNSGTLIVEMSAETFHALLQCFNLKEAFQIKKSKQLSKTFKMKNLGDK